MIIIVKDDFLYGFFVGSICNFFGLLLNLNEDLVDLR